MKSIRERTEIQQAYLDGIRIEHRVISSCNESGSWYEYAGGLFDWTKSEFRIKPKPMEIWVMQFDSGALMVIEDGYVANKPGVIKKFIEVIE